MGGKRKSRAKPHIKKGRKPAERGLAEGGPGKSSPGAPGLTPNQRAFLAAFAGSGLVGLAAEAADVDRGLHARWLKGSAAYRAAFEPAHERAIETMEAEARRRAVEGVQEAVYYEGSVCGHRQRFSDNLLMFLLKAARPEKYMERSQVEMEHRGAVAMLFPELAKPGRAAATATLRAARKAAQRPASEGRRAGRG